MVNGFYLVLSRREKGLLDSYLILDPIMLERLRLADLLRTDADTKDAWTFGWTRQEHTPYKSGMVLTQIFDFDILHDDSLNGFVGLRAFN